MHRKVQVWLYSRQVSLEFLLLKTRPERGSVWQPVTGGVEGGETPAQAALRETVEETGLNRMIEVIPLDFRFDFEARGKRFEEEVFLACLDRDTDVSVDEKEHVDFKWVAAAEAEACIPYPEQRQALRKIIAKLGSPSKGPHKKEKEA